MNDVTPTASDPFATAVAASSPPGARKPARLFRKYLLLILTLVTIALLASGAISIYFTYQETKSSLATLQHEKAVAAASRIEQYVHQIEQQLAYASLPQLDPGDVELRRVEFLRLLRQAPEVTDVAQLDASGRERLAVSRLGMDAINSGKDRSQEQAFREAKPVNPWYGPVYFRKETEPYMTIALRANGERGMLTTADVNLKFIWDVVSRIHIGDKGKAYVVDDNGYLVADPDIGLVLRKTNLSALPHVKAATTAGRNDADLAMVSTDLGGTKVLTSVAPIESLGWNVFVEQPVSEVYAKLNASILRTALLLLAGFVLSALGALALARGMVRPIRTLEEGAERIGAGDLDQRIDVRTGDEIEALADQFNRMSARLRESYAGLERKVEERTQELRNALEKQTAISEILRVISSSPTDVQPVFEIIAERALKLCGAEVSVVSRVEAGEVRLAAVHGMTDEGCTALRKIYPVPVGANTVTTRAIRARAVVQVDDVLADPTYYARDAATVARFRGSLCAPMIREGEVIGAIYVGHPEPTRFTDSQVDLLKTFADQAVIAIENVRLLKETKEALEQQTAISEILRVISSSPSDVRPVLQAVAEHAARLCDAPFARVMVSDGTLLHPMADFSAEPIFAGKPVPLGRTSITGRAVVDRATIHFPDVAAVVATEFPDAQENITRLGCRAVLAVPLLRGGGANGAIFLFRREPGPFSDEQIVLVQTFAQQAAIAIENVRLFHETREALERQTAMSEILRVISRSPTDVQPVLDTIASATLGLSDSVSALVFTYDGKLIHLAAIANLNPEDELAWRSAFPRAPSRETATARAILTGEIAMIPDVLADPDYTIGPMAVKTGFRSAMAVPLIRDGKPIGAIGVGRSVPGPFEDKEISLLKTFADQAVIAIENVRLFNETKEALDRQTAMSGILRAMSDNPTDVQPVFDIISEHTLNLCDAAVSFVSTLDGDVIRLGACRGVRPEGRAAVTRAFPMNRGARTVTARAIRERRLVHVEDVLADPDYEARNAAQMGGYRGSLGVPMLRKGNVIGAIFAAHRDPGRFSDAEVELLKTFADQAAIAIENVRLFKETQEGLGQQTAIAGVLKVISQSAFDLQRVLTTLVETATRLCDASHGFVFRPDGDVYRLAVAYGASPEFEAHIRRIPVRPERGYLIGRVVGDRQPVQILDAAEDPDYRDAESQRLGGYRTMLGVPMMNGDEVVGVIVVWRSEVRAFSAKQIDLLATFADQGAIATENARLFDETREALEQQTAVAQILRVISSSPTDVQPVLDAIAERAAKLCDASAASMYLLDGNALRHLASKGPSPDPVSHVDTLPLDRNSITGCAFLERRLLQVQDMLAEGEAYPLSHELARRFSHRTVVVLPLFREGQPFGTILLRRKEVRPFSERELALLRTFGDQTAIALENVRLFNETKEALEQQRASAEVLAAISSSIADTQPVFEKILTSCERLFAGKVAGVSLVGEDGLIHLVAYQGPNREGLERMFPLRMDESGSGAAILTRSVVHYPDVEHGMDVPERTRSACQAVGYRGVIFAPMLWESKAIGVIFVGREYTGAFSDKDIALLKTFADQAVIAIQNARLFREIQDKSRQLEIANKHKSEFLANMSHELRTPLNAIIGFSEVLLERLFGELNDKQDDYLGDIHSSGKHLLSLINDILDLSKIEAGRMELETSHVDLAAAISNALTLIRERAQRHGIALVQNVDAAAGTIVADERKLKQILLNLLSNAVKFTPDGGRIEVGARRADGVAEIAVRDSGIGIAPEDQPAVFEEFRQVGHDYTKKQEGTGLGLALTRKFVEMHGGRIWLESTPGRGSTFTFTIPLA